MITELLQKLARISPKHYAGLIRDRNQALLDLLNMLDPYVGMHVSEIPPDIRAEVQAGTGLGCPHCPRHLCSECLWLKAGQSCLRALFDCGAYGKLCLLDVDGSNNVTMPVTVHYGVMTSGLILRSGTVLDSDSLAMCKAFVQAHIDWANLDCWGKDYKG